MSAPPKSAGKSRTPSAAAIAKAIATLERAGLGTDPKPAAAAPPPFVVPGGYVEIPGEILTDYGRGGGGSGDHGGVFYQSNLDDCSAAIVVEKNILHIHPREAGVPCKLVMREDIAKEDGLVPL